MKAALLIVLVSAGCVAERKAAFSDDEAHFTDVGPNVAEGLIENGEAAWKKRDDAAQVDDAISAYAAAVQARPQNLDLLVRLGRAYLFRSRGESRDAARESLDHAVAAAERALALRSPELKARALQSKPPSEIFAAADAQDVAALTLYAEALFKWSERQSDATLLAQAPAIRAAVDRAIALDRKYDFGAPDRIRGELLATLPARAGGNLDTALVHLDLAIATAPDYLPNRLAHAVRYLARLRDRERLRRELQAIISADPNALPEAGPENRAAQKAAAELLKK